MPQGQALPLLSQQLKPFYMPLVYRLQGVLGKKDEPNPNQRKRKMMKLTTDQKIASLHSQMSTLEARFFGNEIENKANISILCNALNLFIQAVNGIRAGVDSAAALLTRVQFEIDMIDASANLEIYMKARGIA